MANEYYLDHVGFIIGLGEGSIGGSSGNYYIKYDTVEAGSPFEGIGLMQWSFGRSFDILRDIYVALGNNFGGTTPPSDIASAIQNNNRWESHKWYQGAADTHWVRQFLVLDVAKQVQSNKYIPEIQGYLDQMLKQGLTDLRARAYGADITNQYGGGWGTNFGGARYTSAHNSLDAIHAFTPKTYLNRRNQCYNYLKSANFDNPAPVSYETGTPTQSSTDSFGQQQDYTEPEYTLRNYEQEVLIRTFTKISDTYVTKHGDDYYNKYFRISKIAGYSSNITTMLVHNLIDLYELTTNSYTVMLEIAEEIRQENEANKNQNAKNEVDEIKNTGQVSSAIQKVLDKALSYPDGSVPYSMSGARDMKSSGDCSCYTSICFQAGGVTIGGYTGAQYTTARSNGWIVVEGGRGVISNIVSQAKAGDFLLMAKADSTYGGGGASHTGLIVGSNQFRHQSSGAGIVGRSGVGPFTEPLDRYLNEWVSGYQNFCLCRPLD